MNFAACRAMLTNAKKLRILLSIMFGFFALIYYLSWWFQGNRLTSPWHITTLIIAFVYAIVFWFSVKWTQATKNKSLVEAASLLPK